MAVYNFPGGASAKEPTCQCRRHMRRRFDSWVRKIPCSRKWQPGLVFLPGKLYGQRRLVSYSLWGCTESDRTEQLSTHPHPHIHTHTHTQWMSHGNGVNVVLSAGPSSWMRRLDLFEAILGFKDSKESLDAPNP